MSNPWDRPPIPNRGDEHADITFTAVGKIVSQWELVEFGLSRLYTRLGGKPDDAELMRQYGGETIFRERLNALERIANKYAVGSPNQKFEAELHQLFDAARNYSNRRNDIAHGVLWQIDRLTFFREKLKASLLHRPHFAIIPPLYAHRFADANGFPVYAYTSVEMNRLNKRLYNLHRDINGMNLPE